MSLTLEGFRGLFALIERFCIQYLQSGVRFPALREDGQDFTVLHQELDEGKVGKI